MSPILHAYWEGQFLFWIVVLAELGDQDRIRLKKFLSQILCMLVCNVFFSNI